jgi:PAS domain-containing protein
LGSANKGIIVIQEDKLIYLNLRVLELAGYSEEKVR